MVANSPSTQPSRNHLSGFTVPLPCFLSLCLAGTLEIQSGSHKGVKQMGRCQTETYYRTEASYLKSVLLWLQGNWTKPDPPRFYPLRAVEQGSRYYSGRRTHAALNRRDEIIDLPAFLLPRNSSEYRQRKLVNQGRENNR